MRSPVFVGSAFVAQYPEGGGNFWVPLQWVLGLRDAGVDAIWYELLWTRGTPERDRECIDAFLRYVAELGVADRTVLLYFPDGGRDEPPGRVVVHGANADALLARRADALLLNLAHSVTAPLRDGFPRTALLDLDP